METRAPSAPRPRGRPRRAAARQEIVDATLELLAERGFQGTTMDAIAARAGVGKNTIYRRWSSKEELIADTCRTLTMEPELEGDDLHELLLAHIHDFVRIFSDPVLAGILPGLLGELHRNPEFAEAWSERVVHPRRDALVDLLRAALERGEIRAGTDPEVIADLVVAPPFTRLTFPFGLSEAPVAYAEQLLETIWRGIEPD
jgi:AcrR family transcriptional regulator